MSSTSYNALAAAIAQEENSTYLNNPGALMDPITGQPMTFSTPQAGLDALTSQLGFDMSGQSSYYSPNETLAQYESTYTGGNPNAGNNVASILGVSPSTPMSQLSDQSIASSSPSIFQRMQDAINKLFYGTANPTPQQTQNNPLGGMNPAAAPPPTAAQVKSGIAVSIGTDAVAILLGLILVAISVFGLSKVQETVKTAAKGASVALA